MFKFYRIAVLSLGSGLVLVGLKYLFHRLGWELVEQSSLHNSVISSVIFVIGFVLSATIADYKESERIPSEFAANVEDMYEDAVGIHRSYAVFDLEGYRSQLQGIAEGFAKDARYQSGELHRGIQGLSSFFADMEKGGVPPNFIVKLKQQQVLLLKHRHRISYIQRIRFIPSATILVRSLVTMTFLLLLFTKVTPFLGGLAITWLIGFVMVYMVVLIEVISVPFHPSGTTRDDVSLFLIEDTVDYLASKSSGSLPGKAPEVCEGELVSAASERND